MYTTYIRTTPEKLWQAITDPAFSNRYMGHAMASDFQKGSTYVWVDNGIEITHPDQVILESDPYNRLAFTFHTFVPELIHDDFGAESTVRQLISGGWPWKLANLKTGLEES